MATALIITLLVLDIFIGGSFGLSSLCQIPKNPNNGQVNCVNDDRNVLKCYATCNSGFTFQHTSVEFRTCNQIDGTWPAGQTFPDCLESVSKCQSLTPPKNGVVKCEKPNGNLICTAKCDKQYIFPSGQSTIKQVCNATTGWQPENRIPNCIASCNTQYLISGNPTIKDADFKVSSTMSVSGKSFNPKKSDIYCTSDCGWRPTSSNLNQFVQINLTKVFRLLGVVTKGLTLGSSELFVTRFRILHSIDGKTFVPYSDRNVTDRFFTGNSDGSTARLNIFSCPFQAQYIIINPLEWNDGIGLRFDLLGCDIKTFPITTPTPVTDKTTRNPLTPSSSGTTSHPFQACSAILPPANGAVNCQKTNNVLSCTALCNDGFQFATPQLLVRLTCQIQTGQWDGNKVFPACIAIQHVSSTTLPPFTHKCIRTQSDCNRFGNGDFQTCGDCRYFATCSEGIVYIRPCPNNLVFDSNTKTCQFHSATCHSLNPFG